MKLIAAHEMGHALHSYYSNKYQNPIDADYSIFVAEVASTCNEALLMEHLLANTTEKKERAYLINHFLDQFKGTLYRQTMFAEFELNIGKMVAEGQTLTADVLCAEYRRLNEVYFGPDMVVDDLKSKGISPVYLVTDHTGFYERYGWNFLCMVQGDGEVQMSRMYIHRYKEN